MFGLTVASGSAGTASGPGAGIAVHGSVVNVVVGLPISGVEEIATWTPIVTDEFGLRLANGKAGNVARSHHTRGFVETKVVRKEHVKNATRLESSLMSFFVGGQNVGCGEQKSQ